MIQCPRCGASDCKGECADAWTKSDTLPPGATTGQSAARVVIHNDDLTPLTERPSLSDPALLYAQEYRAVREEIAGMRALLEQLLTLPPRIVALEGVVPHVNSTLGEIRSHLSAREAEGKGYRNGIAGKRLLLVDDEAELRKVLAREFEKCGVIVSEARNAEQAEQVLAEHPSGYFDAALIDVVLPHGRSGIDIAADVRDAHPKCRIVLQSGYPDVLHAKEASALRAIATIKPTPFIALKELLFPG